ncbi:MULTISPECIES: hypothetical protein [unclassified Pseudomonas]|uniref:hypothetical protein n=1 Tax=unclassified Pseudomonas TaxID=196821 RepID=UPI001CBED0E5|nr:MULTISPECIES: hypothetical protein [unclassified Pseudomonas]
MSGPNYWGELLVVPAVHAASANGQAERLERLVNIAEFQGERLSTGIAAIGELMEGAVAAGQVDDGVAVDICWLMAALAGLSVQLAALRCNAHSTLAKFARCNDATIQRQSAPHLSPVSLD